MSHYKESTVNHPSYDLSVKLSELGFNDETTFTWEHTEFWTVTILSDDKKRVVSERYTPKPTWMEVINFLTEKYNFVFKVSGGSNGGNGHKMFFWEFTDQKTDLVHFNRNYELHLVYEEMINTFINLLK